MDQEEKNIAENEFKNWLDKNKIPYWYINQNTETFSMGLKNQFTKRPDFFILIPNFGFVVVDVKDKKPAVKHEKFFIPTEEVEKYINLQRLFNLPCWYVISNEDVHYKTWFWIPVTKIIKIKFRFNGPYKECYSVPITEFIQVSNNDSLERVFSEFLRFV